MSIYTASYLVEWKPGGAWVDITSNVMSVEGDFQTTGSGSGFGFGDSSSAEATIKLDLNATGSPLSVATWAYVPIRVTFTAAAVTARGAAGVIIDLERDIDVVTLKMIGYQQLISRVRVFSQLLLNRPVATKTTALSIDDPTNGSYAAGILNWIMWQAGGRPYEQSATYTTATFYYSLAQAPIAPKYTWVAGEDGWAESLRLVRSVGGQLYQRPDGVIAYVSPLTMAGGTSQFTYTEDDYREATMRGSARDLVSSYSVTYIPRALAGVTEIVSDGEARVAAAGATITIELQPQYPFINLETVSGGTQLLSDAISATFYDGTQVAQAGSGGYTHTLSVAAQHITLTITNTGSLTFVIEKITLRAQPVIPGEPGTITVGSGTPTVTIEESPYIQSRSHARRLARQALDFYGTARPIITLAGCAYNPALQVGHAGTLTVASWGLSAVPVVILGIKHSDTGLESDLDVIQTSGIPALADYFVISTASQSGLTKYIGY